MNEPRFGEAVAPLDALAELRDVVKALTIKNGGTLRIDASELRAAHDVLLRVDGDTTGITFTELAGHAPPEIPSYDADFPEGRTVGEARAHRYDEKGETPR